MIWISTLKAIFFRLCHFLSSLFLWNDFLSSCGCLTNRPRLLKNFLKSLTAMAYSSSSLSEVELSSSLDSFATFKALELFSMESQSTQTIKIPILQPGQGDSLRYWKEADMANKERLGLTSPGECFNYIQERTLCKDCRVPEIKIAGTGSLHEDCASLKKTTSNALVSSVMALAMIRVTADEDHNDTLVKDLRTARVSVVSYKTGLESVEARLLVFKKNESVYEEDIKLLKREIYLRDLDITELKRKLELVTKEKDEVQLTVQKFENSSKSLSELLDRQIMDKCKTGLGYNAVPPPYTRNFMPPKHDLVYPSLDDFVEVNESASESVVEKPTVETNEPKTARKEDGAPIIEDWVSKSEEEDVPKIKTVEMFNKPSFAKINFVKSTKQVKSPRNTSVDKNRQNTPSPRGNKRNWNQQMSQKLGNDFEMFNKACHV
ncbi:hypothetical protein Tco_0774024 [Tanacetum coccineum]|uniref:Uncharacterized protein n=1 Tax=Tanacetum coccineum TaxID=301880 RepID=A0ABQ4ZRM4_9ASTR